LITHIFLTEVLPIFLDFVYIHKNKNELKREKQEKEECYINLKEQTHSGATSPSLGDCMALEKILHRRIAFSRGSS
jgi:hypothetical protein